MTAVTLLLGLCAILHRSSSIPLSDFYPFGESENDSFVRATLDGASDRIDLNQTFPLFNGSYDQIYVNNNGIISFNGLFSDFLPETFPYRATPVLAPFWADADTRVNGTVWYDDKSDDTELLTRAQEEVRRYFSSQEYFEPYFLFVATWDEVPHYISGTKTNTYQCTLISDGLQSFTFFYYADDMIEWTTGDVTGTNGLGGRPAEIGYDSGDGIWYHSIPTSGTADVINIASTSNVGIGGVWAFRLDEEEDPVVTCSDITPVTLRPLHGNMLGGTGVFIQVCQGISEDESVDCYFGTSEVAKGRRLNETFAVCVSPLLQRSGYIPLEVVFESGRNVKSHFFSLSPEIGHAATILDTDVLLFNPDDIVTIKWSPESIVGPGMDANILVDIGIYIQFYRFDTNSFQLSEIEKVENRANDGEQEIKISENAYLQCTSLDNRLFLKLCSIIFKVSVSDSQNLPKDIGIWTGMAFWKPSSSTKDEDLAIQCDEWSESTRNRGILPLLGTLPPCPPTLPLAIFDINYQQESMVSQITRDEDYHKTFMKYFHDQASVCYRQSNPFNNGPGQQCCYGENNALVKRYSGGSADTESPLRSYYRHVVDDLLPYILCCKGDYNICDKYYRARPEGDETGYLLPIPACIYGDPHIVTLDGHKYTFNGKGEYILIQTSSNIFAIQGRMEQALDPEGTPSPGTVFTAIVAKQISTNTTVQFEIDPDEDSLLVLVDGQREDFDGLSIQEYENVILLDKGNSTVQALFSSGANVEISMLNSIVNVMLVALPNSMKQMTSGLMGSFNDIISDDLTSRNGGGALLLDESVENIHYKFGITWIIKNESESLFTYNPGEGWSKYYFPDFIPMFAPTFNDTALHEEAKEICGEDSFCLFDIAATKRVEIGAATMEGQEMLDAIVEMSKPITCSPVCENGVCLENNTCSCSDGYQGSRCSEPVLEECIFNPCRNNGSCHRQSLVYSCECSPQFTGSFCQNKVPLFRIRMLNGSPRVVGNSVQVEFSPTKAAFSKCALDGRSQDCSNGFIWYNNVTSGSHNFRIVSLTNNKERSVLRRRIFIGPCALHLINDGLGINGRDVIIKFTGTAGTPNFHCQLDNLPTNTNCKSPLRYKDLDPGQHRVILRPDKCVKKGQGVLSIKFGV